MGCLEDTVEDEDFFDAGADDTGDFTEDAVDLTDLTEPGDSMPAFDALLAFFLGGDVGLVSLEEAGEAVDISSG